MFNCPSLSVRAGQPPGSLTVFIKYPLTIDDCLSQPGSLCTVLYSELEKTNSMNCAE